MYNKNRELHFPRALSCMVPDGAIVSTLTDTTTFLKSYFGGRLFPAQHLPQMQRWNPMFFPMEYGYGLWRYHRPKWMSPFTQSPNLIGHAGSTGAFAFRRAKQRSLPRRNVQPDRRSSTPVPFSAKSNQRIVRSVMSNPMVPAGPGHYTLGRLLRIYPSKTKTCTVMPMADQYSFRVHIEEVDNGQFRARSDEMPRLVAQRA